MSKLLCDNKQKYYFVWENCNNLINFIDHHYLEENLPVNLALNRCILLYDESEMKYWKNIYPEYVKYIKKASIDSLFDSKCLNDSDIDNIKFVSEILIEWHKFRLFDKDIYILLMKKIDSILQFVILKLINYIILQTRQGEEFFNDIIRKN